MKKFMGVIALLMGSVLVVWIRVTVVEGVAGSADAFFGPQEYRDFRAAFTHPKSCVA